MILASILFQVGSPKLEFSAASRLQASNVQSRLLYSSRVDRLFESTNERHDCTVLLGLRKKDHWHLGCQHSCTLHIAPVWSQHLHLWLCSTFEMWKRCKRRPPGVNIGERLKDFASTSWLEAFILEVSCLALRFHLLTPFNLAGSSQNCRYTSVNYAYDHELRQNWDSSSRYPNHLRKRRETVLMAK